MFAKRMLLSAVVLGLFAACSDDAPEEQAVVDGDTATQEAAAVNTPENPFFAPSSLELQFPRFDLIRNEHYLPAFERGMQDQLAEIGEITRQTAEPSFANTLVPLEVSGQLLSRVLTVFFALSSAHTNDVIQELEVEISPRLSAHRDSILLNEQLFARVKAVYDTRDSMGLDPESLRLVEETYKDFVLSGAQLDAEQKDRLKAINAELAELETRFDQNVLAEVNDSAVVVDSSEELAGLTDAEIQTAADAAVARDLPGKYVLPLLNTSGQPLLTTLENRALRQRIMETSLVRGGRGNEYDNREVLSRTARLRAERAQLLGFPHHAAVQLAKQTAQTVEAVQQRLADLIPRAVANAEREAAELQAQLQTEGVDFQLAA